MPSGRALLLSIIALLTVNFLIFGQSLTFGFVPFDDPAYVTGNGYINRGISSGGIKWALWYQDGGQALLHDGAANLWHPLTWFSHMLDVTVFGLDAPWGHHLVNLLLHGLSSLLLFFIAFRLIKSAPAAFVVALLWMIHPLKAESVAWISERKGLLSGAFFWGSLACTLQALNSPSSRWRQASWLLFVCALLSKPSVVILPGLLILLEGFLRDEKGWGWSFWKNSVLRYKWWFATSLIAALIAISMQSGGSHAYFMAQSSLIQRMIPQATAMAFYLWRTFIPWDLSLDYPQPAISPFLHFASWAILIVSLGIVFRLRRRYPRFFFAIAWWCLCLLPVSGLVYVGASFTSDRYLYLALAGPLLALLPFLKTNLAPGKKPSVATLAVIALIWSGLSFSQTKVWKNGWTLFEHATNAQPRSSLGWSNLGSLHQKSGNLTAARACFEEAVALDSSDHIAWFNLGKTLKELGDTESAEQAYQTSLLWYPRYYPALKNLALLLMENDQIPEAAKLLQDACQATDFQDPVVLWLSCETELAQGNYEAGQQLLERLEALPISNKEISTGMQRARVFLKSNAP